jgi:hypothetical protein
MPVHDCFAGITVPSLLFYVAAVPGFAFALLAWLVRNRSDANVIVFYSVLPQALLYALFLAAAIGQRPAILWSVFTLKQVTWMYTSPLIVVASLAHYAASDLIAARVVWIIFRALGATQWYYHLIFVMLYLYAPVGFLLAMVVILSKDPTLSVLSRFR